MGINLTSIYISDLIAVVLIIFMHSGDRWKIINDRIEKICIRIMFYTVIMASIIDALTFAMDGKDGVIAWLCVYIGNGALFCLNMVIGPAWSTLVIHHVRGSFTKYEKYIIGIPCIIGAVLIIINLFVPVVFHVDAAHVYHRDFGYMYYVIMELLFLIYGSVIYGISKSRGGILKFFPVFYFIIPILIGLIIQTVFYGVSVIPAFVSISVCVMINSLQNENIYRDSLTGLYNRAYLDYLKRESNIKKNGTITAIMIDLNDFKSINDRFGHTVGDEALINVADILRTTIGDLGSVIRYAGDEFVVLINTSDEKLVKVYIHNLNKNADLFNSKEDNKYQLSFATGYYSVDLKQNTVDHLLNEVDSRMYLDKESYYKNNPQKNRRRADAPKH